MVDDRLVTMQGRTISLYPRTGFYFSLTPQLLIGALAGMRNFIPRSQLWGITGQECFQPVGVAFYRGADSRVLVYDNSAWTWSEGMECGR